MDLIEDIVTEQPVKAECVSPQMGLFRKSNVNPNDNRLEFLKDYDSLIVKQKLDVLGSVCRCGCCDKLNKYHIKDKEGKTVLTAIEEEENCCHMSCCRSGRRFNMKILNKSGEEVIHLKMPGQCCGRCCCFCRYQKLNVLSPPDSKIGSIEESWSCFHKRLKIYNSSSSDPIYYVDGPTCQISKCCCSDYTFTITNYETGEESGSIAKKWSGLVKETVTNIDNFKVTFPKNINVTEKALLLGTCIMIDLMYFEENKDNEEDSD